MDFKKYMGSIIMYYSSVYFSIWQYGFENSLAVYVDRAYYFKQLH